MGGSAAPGASRPSAANWFAGVYLNEKNFFPQFAVEAKGYLDLYPEFMPPEQFRDFLHDRKGALAPVANAWRPSTAGRSGT